MLFLQGHRQLVASARQCGGGACPVLLLLSRLSWTPAATSAPARPSRCPPALRSQAGGRAGTCRLTRVLGAVRAALTLPSVCLGPHLVLGASHTWSAFISAMLPASQPCFPCEEMTERP